MSILDVMNLFRKTKTAEIAKNRLHIIIAQEKSQKNAPDYLQELRQEILKLVEKYTKSNPQDIDVTLHRRDHNSVLELNVTLPD